RAVRVTISQTTRPCWAPDISPGDAASGPARLGGPGSALVDADRGSEGEPCMYLRCAKGELDIPLTLGIDVTVAHKGPSELQELLGLEVVLWSAHAALLPPHCAWTASQSRYARSKSSGPS